MIRTITSFGFVGLIPVAPGTFGSLAALPVGYALHVLGGFPLLAIATILLTPLGIWATEKLTAGQDEKDPSEVVVDEVVGQWLALWPLSFGLWHAGADSTLFPWPGWVGAFLLFRLFDIWKPGPIGWADRLHSPLGTMLDDVFAGLFAAVGVAAAAGIAHGALGL